MGSFDPIGKKSIRGMNYYSDAAAAKLLQPHNSDLAKMADPHRRPWYELTF